MLVLFLCTLKRCSLALEQFGIVGRRGRQLHSVEPILTVTGVVGLQESKMASQMQSHMMGFPMHAGMSPSNYAGSITVRSYSPHSLSKEQHTYPGESLNHVKHADTVTEWQQLLP